MRPGWKFMMNCANFPKWRQLVRISSFRKTYRNPRPKTPSILSCCSQHFSSNGHSSSDVQDAQVVICGGGICGVSLAYHLAKRGWTDVLLLEQGSLTCGTTWHAAGLVGLIKGNLDLTRLAGYSADLYETLESETGLSTGYKRTGSVLLATVEDRMVQLKRLASMASYAGVENHIVNPSEIQDIVPWISVDDVIGGIYVPRDGVTDPTNTVMSLARGAKIKGVRFAEKVSVERILTSNGRVTGVETGDGKIINCQYFVNAAGMWARNVGQMSTPAITVPLQPNQHQYAVFKPKDGINYKTPYVRDWDNQMYIREWSEGVMLGAFAQTGKPVYVDGKPPRSEYISLPEDWEQFGPQFNAFLKRVPSGRDLELRQLFDGPESFTPDLIPIVGEAPEISNYFVMAGMHSYGVTMGGALGKHVADWIIDGKPSRHMGYMDVKRFSAHHNRLDYLQDRVTETEGNFYKLVPPGSEFKKGRQLCCTALYDRLCDEGAVFGEAMGVEQPLYFDRKGNAYKLVPPGSEFKTGRQLCCPGLYDTLCVEGAVFGEAMGVEQPLYFDRKDNQSSSEQGSIWGKPAWFDTVLAEYQSCMANVGVVDMSAMAVFELKSSNSACLPLLEKLCSSDMSALGPGCCSSTWMLNNEGGIVNDCVVIHQAPNRYIILSPICQWTVAKSWISQYLPEDRSVTLTDLTPGSESYQKGAFSILGVIGHEAQTVLNRINGGTTIDLHRDKNQCIKYGDQDHILTNSLTGNKGFLLLIPHQTAKAEYQKLMSANQDVGILNVGHYALHWMQGENRIPAYGIDYDCNDTPGEIACVPHLVHLEKGVEFIGQQALQKTSSGEPTKQLVQFVLEELDVHADLWPWGTEPIYYDGKPVGYVSSASYSPSQGKVFCFGQIDFSDHLLSSGAENGVYEIEIAGKRFGARLRNGQMFSIRN